MLLWLTITGIVLMSFVLFLLIYFILARHNWFFTFVKEGTAKIVLKAGKFHKILIQWEGKTLNTNWNVIKGSEWHPFGGLRWVGFWPIYTVYKYKFEWTGVKPNGQFEFHPKEELNYILLKDDVYGCQVLGAEDQEKLPLDVELTVTLAIANPYKALFAVQNWFETLSNRLTPYVRDFITNHTYTEMIETEIRLDREIWKRLEEEGILTEFQRRYGVNIRKIEVRNFDPQSEYREATLRKYQAERDAEARTHKTTGALIQMIAQATGKTPQQVQAEIETSPALKERFMNLSSDLITRQMAIDGQSFVDIRVQGATGVEQALLNVIAAWQRMPNGKGMPGGGSGSVASEEGKRGKKNKKETEEDEDEDIEERELEELEREEKEKGEEKK